MSMVRLHQHLRREKEMKVQGLTSLCSATLLWGARSETVLTLLKVSISTNCKRSSLTDPDLWTKARPAKQNVWKYGEKHVKTNKTDLKLYGFQESEPRVRKICYGLKTKTWNLPYKSKFDAIRNILIAVLCSTMSFFPCNVTLSPICLCCLLSLQCIFENKGQ